jgi:hypothetical protein
MKLRTGFVSNSSGASFCIYGWTNEELGLSGSQVYAFLDMIQALDKSIVESSHPSVDRIIGVGEIRSEVDHSYEGDDWHDYRCPEPSKKDMAKLDAIAKKLGLPKPTLQAETWYDG